MNIQTSWVKPPDAITGLDHLGVQATCINLYGHMLPGITNVTDRARYYSFYPWIVWRLEKKGYSYGLEFIKLFRRADCLLTLIANRHALVAGGDNDDHAAATVGVDTLKELVSQDVPILLSDYTQLDSGKQRYFKNPLGGLGQYYIGVLRYLEIMGGDATHGIKNVVKFGDVLAEAMEHNVPGDLFFETIKDDIVTLSRLDDLAQFCPCMIQSSIDEHRLLCSLFFGTGIFSRVEPQPYQEMIVRRKSLQLIQILADSLAAQGVNLDQMSFRGVVYSSALPDGTELILSERLQMTRSQWAIYQRNEILSLALQGLFFSLLDAYDSIDRKFHTVEELCSWFLGTYEVKSLAEFAPLDSDLASLFANAGNWLPALNDWVNPEHEHQLARRIESLSSKRGEQENRAIIVQSAIKSLIALGFRSETAIGYGEFSFPAHYYDDYPVNLQSFISHVKTTWSGKTLESWLVWLISEWGIKTHLRVALRKLRGQSKSTFRIRPSDRGMEVIDAPPAVFTNPRFKQSVRILKDMGVLVKNKGVLINSPLGRQQQEVVND